LDVDSLDQDSQTQSPAQFPAKGLVPTGRLTEPVVQVPHADEAEPSASRQLSHDKEQGDGIRASREPDQYAAARRAEPVALDRPPDTLE
jgi:hypothetical protein